MSGLYIGTRSACERHISYRTESKAIRAASGATWRAGNHPRVYRCPTCSKYHLTSRERCK